MALTAPDTDPTVKPTPVSRQGSVWVTVATIAGVLLALLPALPLPDSVRPWLPAITAVLGWLAHQTWGDDEYRPAPNP